MSDSEKSQEVPKDGNSSHRENSSSSGSEKSKRKSEVANVLQHGRQVKRRRVSSQSRSPGPSRHGRHDKYRRKAERDYKLDKIFNWVRDSQFEKERRYSSRYSSRSSLSHRGYRSRSSSRDRYVS